MGRRKSDRRGYKFLKTRRKIEQRENVQTVISSDTDIMPVQNSSGLSHGIIESDYGYTVNSSVSDQVQGESRSSTILRKSDRRGYKYLKIRRKIEQRQNVQTVRRRENFLNRNIHNLEVAEATNLCTDGVIDNVCDNVPIQSILDTCNPSETEMVRYPIVALTKITPKGLDADKSPINHNPSKHGYSHPQKREMLYRKCKNRSLPINGNLPVHKTDNYVLFSQERTEKSRINISNADKEARNHLHSTCVISSNSEIMSAENSSGLSHGVIGSVYENTVDASVSDQMQHESISRTPKDLDVSVKFVNYCRSISYHVCGLCKKIALKSMHSSSCKDCTKYQDCNNMDPGDIPLQLQNLSHIEQQLIARCHVVMSIFRLRCGRQYGYRGHIITFPQEVNSVCRVLPHRLCDVPDIIYFQKGAHDGTFRDFRVRALKVKLALLWLKRNNPLYFDIEISEERIGNLPSDGNACDYMNTLQSFRDSDVVEECEQDDLLFHHGVPNFYSPEEKEQIQCALWPTVDVHNPVNEFGATKYICLAFPTLFPYGRADLKETRQRKVNPSAYFRHMIQFNDRRFVKDPRFRFFAFNSLMRWKALSSGILMIKRKEYLKNMTAKELKEAITVNPSLAKELMFYGHNLRGTRAYWNARRSELETMIQQIENPPTLFFTLSSADMHWPDLYRLLSPNRSPDEISSGERQKLIQDNPDIVDLYFLMRVEFFIKNVLYDHLKLHDHFYRIEYQSRGSIHVHGLLWLHGSPDYRKFDEMSQEELNSAKLFYDNLVTAENPMPWVDMPDLHPCRRSVDDVSDAVEDLAQLMMSVQRHTKCSDKFCIRLDKKTGTRVCRFGFPKELLGISTLCMNSQGAFEYKPKRNDPLLNTTSPFILRNWRANCDVSVITNMQAVSNYIAKYTSKSECQSKTYQELLYEVSNDSVPNSSAIRAIQKALIATCAERDYGSQEICHFLLNQKLIGCSREFTIINLRTSDWEQVYQQGFDNNNRGTIRESIIDKYMSRPRHMDNITLWKFASEFRYRARNSWSLRKKKCIVRVFPILKLIPDNTDNNEQFYRVQVLLHVPWRREANFLQLYESWYNAYLQCNANTNERTIMIPQTEEAQGSSTFMENYNRSDAINDVLEEWMVIARTGRTISDPPVKLGFREIDLNYNWDTYCGEYGDIANLRIFLTNEKKKEENQNINLNTKSNCMLNDEQTVVFKLVQNQVNAIKNFKDWRNKNIAVPRRVVLLGKAGSGKTYLVSYISDYLNKMLGPGSFLLLAPTGVAALNFGGTTIHSALRIPIKSRDYVPLKGESRRILRDRYERLCYLFIDEYSMIGAKLLALINLRLKELFPNARYPLGSLMCFLIGDCRQLPPVADYALHCKPSNANLSSLRHQGHAVYESFETCCVLSKSMRHDNRSFSEAVDRLSTGLSTEEDYENFKKRFIGICSRNDYESFKHAIRLFPTCKSVKDYNMEKLQSLNKPVAAIPSIHNIELAASASDDTAQGLCAELHLCIGCRVFLRCNLWVEKGLVNGSLGTVKEIIYENGKKPPFDQPSIILVEFDSTSTGLANTKIIPIAPICRSWQDRDVVCTRQQFPLSLGWAATVHKSQGLTFDKVVIDVGSRDFSAGLTYVAISRGRNWNSILLQPFQFNRLRHLRNSKSLLGRLHAESELLKKLYTEVDDKQ